MLDRGGVGITEQGSGPGIRDQGSVENVAAGLQARRVRSTCRSGSYADLLPPVGGRRLEVGGRTEEAAAIKGSLHTVVALLGQG